MARSPKTLDIRQIESLDLTLLYTVPVNVVTSPKLVLTNASSSIIEIDIIINDTVTDFKFDNLKLPGGIGKNKRVISVSDLKLNTGFKIKVQSTTATAFNVFLSGTEINGS